MMEGLFSSCITLVLAQTREIYDEDLLVPSVQYALMFVSPYWITSSFVGLNSVPYLAGKSAGETRVQLLFL